MAENHSNCYLDSLNWNNAKVGKTKINALNIWIDIRYLASEHNPPEHEKYRTKQKRLQKMFILYIYALILNVLKWQSSNSWNKTI